MSSEHELHSQTQVRRPLKSFDFFCVSYRCIHHLEFIRDTLLRSSSEICVEIDVLLIDNVIVEVYGQTDEVLAFTYVR